MNHFKSWAFQTGTLALSGTLAIGITLTTAAMASAQAAYGSYVGVGVSAGLTDGAIGEDRQTSGLATVRYRLLEIPVSLRAQAMIFSDAVAIVPTVSYDIPLNWNTDAYIGAGVAIQDGGRNSTSPIGNQTAFVIQPGVDYSLPNSNLVIFGNAIIAFDAYRENGGTAASLQGGVGLRF